MIARLRLRSEGGFSMPEMLVVLVVMGIVTTALVQLFVSASRAQVDISNRFQAQQEGRLALDTLRREIHCASAIVSTHDAAGSWPSGTSRSIKVTLGSYCSGAPVGGGDVTWCVRTVSTNRHELRRVVPALAAGATCAGGVVKAEYLTTPRVFGPYTLPGGGLRAKLSIDLPIDVKPFSGQSGCPAAATACYRLTDDIALRNTART